MSDGLKKAMMRANNTTPVRGIPANTLRATKHDDCFNPVVHNLINAVYRHLIDKYLSHGLTIRDQDKTKVKLVLSSLQAKFLEAQFKDSEIKLQLRTKLNRCKMYRQMKSKRLEFASTGSDNGVDEGLDFDVDMNNALEALEENKDFVDDQHNEIHEVFESDVYYEQDGICF